MVVACIALLVALGGTSVAAVTALAPNSVGTAQLKTSAVTTAKIKNNNVTGADIAPNAVTGLGRPERLALRATTSRRTRSPAGPAGPAGPGRPRRPRRSDRADHRPLRRASRRRRRRAQRRSTTRRPCTVNCNANEKAISAGTGWSDDADDRELLDAADHAGHHEQQRDRLPRHGRQRQRQREHVHAVRALLQGLSLTRAVGPPAAPPRHSRHEVGTAASHVRPYGRGCSAARSRSRSSASSRGASRSRRTCARATLPSFSIVGLADRACQEAKHRVRSGVDSALLEWPRPARSPSTSRRPRCARRAPASTSPSRSRSSPPRRRSRASGSRSTPASASSASTDASGRSPARSRPPRARPCGPRVGCCAPRTRRQEAALAGVEAVGVRHLAEAVGVPPRRTTRSRRPSLRSAAPPGVGAARPRRRPRAGAWAAGARDRGRGVAQPPPRRPAGHRQDDAGAPAAVASSRRSRTTEALEVTRIHSVAGTLTAAAGLVDAPPVPRAASRCVGRGGRRRRAGPAPGEVSLAHRGVLLLDELPEFPRSVLEALRQPLEDGVVSVARVGGRSLFPARFRLVATMNLCPCGGRGDPRLDCSCTPARVAAYRDKVSRALLDRFDLVVAMPRAAGGRARRGAVGGVGARARPRASRAAGRLAGRRRVERRPRPSSSTAPSTGCRLSGRGRARVARVARTIAALAGSSDVQPGARRRGALVPLAGGARPFRDRSASPSRRARATRRCSLRSPTRRRRCGSAGRRTSSCSRRPPSRSSALARAPATGDRSPACSRREAAAAGVVVVSGLARGDRRGGAPRRARRRRADRRGARMRDRPRLPGRARRARARDRRDGRPDRLRVRAGRRARSVALPGAEPDHRRARSRDGRGRGARAVRRADHRGLRARGRAGGARRARRDHERSERRGERAPAAGRDSGDVRGGRARGDRRRARSRPRRRSPTSAVLRRSSRRSRAERRRRTSSYGRHRSRRAAVAAALVELELAGVVAVEEGVVRSTIAR